MEYHTRDAIVTHIYKHLKGMKVTCRYPDVEARVDLDVELDRKMIAGRVDELLKTFVPESFTGIHAYDPTKKVLSLSWTGSPELIQIRMETVVEVAMGASPIVGWDVIK